MDYICYPVVIVVPKDVIHQAADNSETYQWWDDRKIRFENPVTGISWDVKTGSRYAWQKDISKFV